MEELETYHWESDATIFAICVRIIECANAIILCYTGAQNSSYSLKDMENRTVWNEGIEQLVRAMENLRHIAMQKELHPSLTERLWKLQINQRCRGGDTPQ